MTKYRFASLPVILGQPCPFDLARGSEISRIQSPTLTVSMVKDFAGEEDVKIELGTKTDPYQTPAALVKKRKEYSVLQTSD